MKTFLLIFLLAPFASLLHAQDGVYLTYEDFKANNMIAADENTLNYNFGTSGYASLKQNGVKRKWKLDEIFGIVKDGTYWRAFHSKYTKDGMAPIIQIGNYVYYENRISVPHANAAMGGIGDGHGGGWEGYKMHYFISKDLKSEVYDFTPHLESLDDLIESNKEFKDLKPYLDKAEKGDRSEKIVKKCITNSPEYLLPDRWPKSKK